MQDQLKDLLSSVEAIRKRNDQLYQDSEIETLTESISSVLETLKQEWPHGLWGIDRKAE